MGEEEAIRKFPEKPKPHFGNYTIDGKTIRYVKVDLESEVQKKKHQRHKQPRPRILFIHGSPGGWSAYIDYLKHPDLQRAATLISVDRLGYGGSQRAQVETSIQKHARFLRPLLLEKDQTKQKRPNLLLGHSFGGPVASRMAMDYPSLVDGLIIVAGPASAQLEEPAWYNNLVSWKVINWFLPTDFQTSNAEIMPLAAKLKRMHSLWRKIRSPVTVIHGKTDELVPVTHVDYLAKVLSHVPLRMIVPEREGHFILWRNKPLIVDEILTMLERLKKLYK